MWNNFWKGQDAVNSRFRYVLFDLDGTLTDPKEGICRSVQYALHQMDIEEPDIDKLEPFIGPPLEDSFMEFYHMSKADAEKAIAHYRERFSSIGLFENMVYDGIPQMLKRVKEAGCYLAVASSKPEVFVKRILKHFHLESYFDVVVGSELDGRRSKKEEVVEEALMQLYALKEADLKKGQAGWDKVWLNGKESASLRNTTAMIGDRIFDMNGARAYGLHGVAAAYGYAPEGELEHSGAEYIAATVKELERYLLGEEQPVSRDSSFLRAIYMLVPFVIYELVAELLTWFGMKLVDFMVGMGNGELSLVIAGHSATLAACIRVVALVCTAAVLYFLYRRRDVMPLRRVGAIYYGWTILAGALLAMGLNLAISNIYIAIDGDPQRFAEATVHVQVPLGLAVLLYAIVTPIAEELLFRWLIYGRISRFMGAPLAVCLTALFFGFFHGNLLQGIYAALMGIALALVLYWSGNFWLPVVFHMAANAFVYLASALPGRIYELVIAPFNSIVFTFAGLVVMAYLYRRLRQ
ncbi:MAG: HAD hydrolase-like protein [Lachnospiraceae bacterium]|nr:HAD hydrolase-like protein [Lachnospiraceae bacterium]